MPKPIFKIVSHVTVPVMKIDGTRPVYITMMEPIHKAPESDKQKAARESLEAQGKQVKPVPEIVKVTNLETNEVAQVVCNEVFKTELRQNYPEDGYVNRSFMVSKFAPQGDKSYATYQIAEIEVSPAENEPSGDEPQAEMHEAVEEPELVAAGDHSGGGKRKR